MARRKRRYHGMVSLPLGGMLPPLRSDVSALDVVGGAALGFAGTNVLDALLANVPGLNSVWAQIKGMAGPIFPVVGGLAVGSLSYLLGSKVAAIGKKRGTGLFWGAVAYGAAATVQGFLRGMQIPGAAQGVTFQDVVALPLNGYRGGYGGLLVDNPAPRMNGLLVDNPAPQRSNLAALGQLSMADDYDGMDALASM